MHPGRALEAAVYIGQDTKIGYGFDNGYFEKGNENDPARLKVAPG